jgi:hypothetical protein
MRKILLFIIASILLISLASATISLEKNPNRIYNMGDTLEVPLKITADSPIDDLLTLKLSCENFNTEIYKEYISMNNGEKLRDISVPIKKEVVGDSKGTCSINYQIGTESGNLTSGFKISNKITLSANPEQPTYSPGEILVLSGEAKKENGELFQGTIETNLSGEYSNNMIYSNIVKKGIFSVNINLPNNIKAGTLTVNFYAFEKNNEGKIINEGTSLITVEIKQVPTNLEVSLEKNSIIPEEGIKGKLILHDQTGESMEADAYIAIKNEMGEIVQKMDIKTEQTFEYSFNYSQKPGRWKISGYMQELTNTASFQIEENKKLNTILENNTLTVKNIGNVPYNDLLEVQIGEKLEAVEINLEIGEEKKFTLTAPNGEYLVQIGDEEHTVRLTGNAIDIKELSKKKFFVINPIIWIFLVLILGFIAFMLFKKGYKKTFIGKKIRRRKMSTREGDKMIIPVMKNTLKKRTEIISPQFPAELSISLHGTKQPSDIISLNIKNHSELTGEGGVSETLQNIVNFAEKLKAFTYFTRDNLFFILAPIKTKTFKNESVALSIATEIENIMKHHNKLFKQKIDYGIAIDSGDLLIKMENPIKFMAMTSIMTNLKKISHISDKEIYLSEVIRGRLGSSVKTERKELGQTAIHKLKGIVKKLDNSSFVKGFLHRLERDKQRLTEKKELEKHKD